MPAAACMQPAEPLVLPDTARLLPSNIATDPALFTPSIGTTCDPLHTPTPACLPAHFAMCSIDTVIRDPINSPLAGCTALTTGGNTSSASNDRLCMIHRAPIDTLILDGNS